MTATHTPVGGSTSSTPDPRIRATHELATLFGSGRGSPTADPSPPAPLKDLLTIADLGRDNLLTLLDIAASFKRNPHETPELLRDHSVVLYFDKPSTRTRISFETAVAQLGGTPIVVGPHDLQLDRGETIEDTARVISSYARAFVIRTFGDADVRRFAAAASIPVVNALTDRHHPCQVIGDLLTLRELWGTLEGRRVAFIGDGDNVATSLIQGCALLGIHVAVATPHGYAPDDGLVAAARRVAAVSGADVVVTEDWRRAVSGADAVYTDVWLSMDIPEEERSARTEAFCPYQVNAELMRLANPDAIFLHCLPAHRGEEVSAEVFDGPQSRVFEQAANRLPTEQAVLFALITGRLARPSVRSFSEEDRS